MKTFMIRQSAMKDGQYYIDFNGEYEVSRIRSCTGITENIINHIYEDNGGLYDSERKVYYFEQRGLAVDAVKLLQEKLKPSKVGRTVQLTEEEVEYIRKALINEDSNIIYTNSRIRTSIFDKLNE